APTVNLLILVIAAVGAPLHIFFAWLSDFAGRKPVMLFGLGLAALTFLPGFQMLAAAVNPALTHAAATSPVTVVAAPADCSVQFDPVGKAKFVTSCDIAKRTLADAGAPYLNSPAAAGSIAMVKVAGASIASFSGASLSAPDFKKAKDAFDAKVKSVLKA